MLKVCDNDELEVMVKKCKGVYLFGAGKRLIELNDDSSFNYLGEKVLGLIDNSPSKQNSILRVYNKEFCIKSIDYLCNFVNDDIIIFITPEHYEDILYQLISNTIFENVTIVCFTHIQYVEVDKRSLTKTATINSKGDEKIPKIIHYCWFGKKDIPYKNRQWMESWSKYCPDYKIIEWNESNYDVSVNRYMREAYESNIMGFVPDYARLDIVNTYGGIYLDTDVEIVKNLDELLHDDAFMAFQNDDLVNLGQGFGSVKNNELIQAMLSVYDNESFICEDGKFNLKTSPYYQTEVLTRYGLRLDGTQQNINGTVIYPEKMLCGKSIYTMNISMTDYTHTIHHFDGSWASKESKDMNLRRQREFSLYYKKFIK